MPAAAAMHGKRWRRTNEGRQHNEADRRDSRMNRIRDRQPISQIHFTPTSLSKGEEPRRGEARIGRSIEVRSC